ncbi:MAG TPA: RNA polymerase sigma factor [Actinomycetota bacterium]|nr:RNA polymerase sigma factor [Actinomycetota bacterium]
MAREGTTPSFASDRELVQAFQRGNPGAYDEIYRLYAPRIRRVCARMLKNPQDVDEATQETFLKAFQALGRFNGQYQLGAWLSRIASNVCLDHIRSRARTAHQVALSDEHEVAGTERGPEEIVVGDNPRIQEAIAEIQPLHAQALKLRALGGLSHREMAGELHMTPAQVKALLHRARSSFRRAWDRAEGWALAPLAGIRGFFSDKSGTSQASSNLIGFTPSLSPLLAERVAASAVIVAVALSGAPTAAPEAPAEEQRRRPVAVAPIVDDLAKPPARERATSPAPRSHVAAAPAPVRSEPAADHDPVTKVLEAVGEQSTKLPKDKGGDDGGEDGGDDGGLGTPGPASAKPVVRKVKKVVQDLTH